MRKLLLLVARNRWPLYLSGLLAMAIAAYAVLIYVATRPSAPRPIPRYYETAERWDVDEAAAEASRQLGWSDHLCEGAEPQDPAAQRPIIRDRQPEDQAAVGTLVDRL